MQAYCSLTAYRQAVQASLGRRVARSHEVWQSKRLHHWEIFSNTTPSCCLSMQLPRQSSRVEHTHTQLVVSYAFNLRLKQM
eukprot:scaffold91397_cov22-Tisochrysis_lutea.AAC.2